VNLRPGLTFSDGTPLTADTVKSQFESIVANKEKFSAAYPAPFFDLTSVTVTSPTAFTLSIANGKAASWHDAYLPSWTSSIMKPGSPENKPIGAGPFAFTDVRPGESWTLQKNQSYWDAGSIKLGGVELTHTVVDQPQAALNALQAGQIDATSSLEPSQIPALTGDLKAATTVSPNTSINMHICKSEGPLADARVRKAVNKAIDRDAINDAIYNGAGEPAIQYWPEGHRFFSDELQDLAYDPDGAKQLLQEAGYGNGVDLDMYVIPAFSLPDIAQVLQSQLKEVGINVSIIQAPDYTNQYIVPKKPALGLYPSSQVGAEKLNSVSGSSIGNICGYSDPNLDSVVKQLQGVSVASDQAVQLWDQANSLIVGDALMGFILFRPVISAYDSATVGDMSPLVAANYYVPDPRVTYIKQK
jgi:ABC-type transport system substrate-binding protein